MKVKFPILLKNRKQFNICMKFLEKEGYRWRAGQLPTQFIPDDFPTIKGRVSALVIGSDNSDERKTLFFTRKYRW